MRRIEVTGSEFPIPLAAKEYSDAYDVIGVALSGGFSDLALKGNLEWAERVLTHGPTPWVNPLNEVNCSNTLAHSSSANSKYYNSVGQGFATAAGLIAEKSDGLELFLDERKPNYLGYGLWKNKLIVHGSLGKNVNPWGGSLYVDGSVDEIYDPKGVVYVKGDVGVLNNIYEGVVIVKGRVNECVSTGHPNNFYPTYPSPFVFTSHSVKVLGHAGDSYCHNAPCNESIVLDNAELSLSPDDFEIAAVELCKLCISETLDNLKSGSKSINDFNLLRKFYDSNLRFPDEIRKAFDKGCDVGHRMSYD